MCYTLLYSTPYSFDAAWARGRGPLHPEGSARPRCGIGLAGERLRSSPTEEWLMLEQEACSWSLVLGMSPLLCSLFSRGHLVALNELYVLLRRAVCCLDELYVLYVLCGMSVGLHDVHAVPRESLPGSSKSPEERAMPAHVCRCPVYTLPGNSSSIHPIHTRELASPGLKILLAVDDGWGLDSAP